jgi:hypothetical protein
MACIEQQGSFKSLRVSDWSCPESEEEIPAHAGSASACEIACKAEICTEEKCVPITFIDDEVRDMILGWETCEKTRLDVELRVPATISSDFNFEPTRQGIVPKPPRKFTRSLYRQKLGPKNQPPAPVT